MSDIMKIMVTSNDDTLANKKQIGLLLMVCHVEVQGVDKVAYTTNRSMLSSL